jgi:hypothetical protein
MSYRYERYRERPRSSFRRWIAVLTILVWLILIGLLLVRFVARPAFTRYVEDRVAQRLPAQDGVGTLPVPGDSSPAPAEPGSFTIRESDANQWLVEHRHELQGVDDVRLRFLPGEVQADVTIGGVTSTAHAGVEVVDGKVVATNPRLDPPLGLFVDVTPFATLIENRLNQDLATIGRTVTGISIEQGQLVISIE